MNDQDIEMQVSEEVFYTRLDVSVQNTSIDDILELLLIHARATIQHTGILHLPHKFNVAMVGSKSYFLSGLGWG